MPGHIAAARCRRFAYLVAGRRHGSALPLHLHVASTQWSRALGLFRFPRLGRNEGLWLRPCKAIHTIGMRRPIDVIFLDRNRKVVKAVQGLAPNRIAWCFSAYSVVELPAGYCRNRHYQAAIRRALHYALRRTHTSRFM